MHLIKNIQEAQAMNQMSNRSNRYNNNNNRKRNMKKIIYEHSLGELSSLYDCSPQGSNNNNDYNNNKGNNEPWFTSFTNGKDTNTVDFLYFTGDNIQAKGYFNKTI